MNLRSVDLNLLVTLDALLSEKQVTRAGKKIGLTQPAVSNALGRLRHMFKDEILVRAAAGMELTPRAKALAPTIRQILQQIEALLASEQSFDPLQSERQFALRMSDLTELLFLPALSRSIRATAPKVKLSVVHLSPQHAIEALIEGTIDMALSTGLDDSGSLRSQILLRDRMVCVTSRRYVSSHQPLSLDRFVALDFLNVSSSCTGSGVVDSRLAELHCARRVVLTVPHWLVVPDMLIALPVSVIMSARHAATLQSGRFAIQELPLALEPLIWSLYWHPRHDTNNAHRWLRTRILESTASMKDQSLSSEAEALC
ncbi:LysR family transcriptional regulator [Trinickia sp. NRRL B-1857]|uniref:LysR family transcriptional regulator n=1 Tax=Trinickia sp. NRRL B-1857 TaxID=3162879 RepID=UPI003D2E2F3B